MKWFLYITAFLLFLAVGLRVWRHMDQRRLADVWKSLVSTVDTAPPVFDPDELTDLPEPAQRYFRATIEEGTPLYRAAEITMRGEFSLGTKDKPDYLPMRACQLLVAPYGFFWQTRTGRGLMHFIGSDAAYPGGSWTRFWLAGLLPVARMGNTADHALSSFGRYMAEAIFWTPAALLPSPSVRWEALDENSTRVTVTHDGMTQAFDVLVDAMGRPEKIRFQRWSDANEARTYRRQPFGGYLSDFQFFDGFWLPTTVQAGNNVDTEAYFPFFKATIDRVVFIKQSDQKRTCSLPF